MVSPPPGSGPAYPAPVAVPSPALAARRAAALCFHMLKYREVVKTGALASPTIGKRGREKQICATMYKYMCRWSCLVFSCRVVSCRVVPSLLLASRLLSCSNLTSLPCPLPLPPHTLTPSHPHTLTPSHPHTLTPSPPTHTPPSSPPHSRRVPHPRKALRLCPRARRAARGSRDHRRPPAKPRIHRTVLQEGRGGDTHALSR